MASNFPVSLDTSTEQPSPSGTSLVTALDHAALHTNHSGAIIALETKLGVAAGSPVAGRVLVGSGNGTSVWGTSVGSLNLGTPIVTGGTFTSNTLSNPTIGTPTITGGTVNSVVMGTPTIDLGTAGTVGDLYYRSQSGTVTRLPVGTSGQYLTTNGTTPNWGAGGARFASSGTIADYSNTSNVFTPVTSGSVVVAPSGAATLHIVSTGNIYDASGTGADMQIRITVNGTVVQSLSHRPFATNIREGFALSGQLAVGTAGTVKLELAVSNNSDTVHVENANVSVIYG